MTVSVDVAAFDAYVDEVDRYGRTWWTLPGGHRAVFARRPSLRARLLRELAGGSSLVPTRWVWGSGGGWETERVAVHDSVLDGLLPAPSSGVPGSVYVLLGLPGSGKSSSLRPVALGHAGVTRAAVSDADAVRVALPEFSSGLGSVVVQEETVVLTYGDGAYPVAGGLQPRVLVAGGVAVVDVVGNSTHLPGMVRMLAGAGRQVYLLLADCPVAVCVLRAQQRALATGRYVPLDYIRGSEGAPREALDAALATGAVTGWGCFDTSSAPARLADGDGTFA